MIRNNQPQVQYNNGGPSASDADGQRHRVNPNPHSRSNDAPMQLTTGWSSPSRGQAGMSHGQYHRVQNDARPLRQTPSPAAYYHQEPSTARRDTVNRPIKTEIADDDGLPPSNQVIDISSSDDDRDEVEEGAAAISDVTIQMTMRPEGSSAAGVLRRHRSVEDLRVRNTDEMPYRRDFLLGSTDFGEADSNDEFSYGTPYGSHNRFEENAFSSLPPVAMGAHVENREDYEFGRHWDSSGELFQDNADLLNQPMNLANRLKRSRQTGQSRSKVFLMNNGDEAAAEGSTSTDDDSSNEPSDTKPLLIKNHGEFSGAVSSSTSTAPVTVKQEIKTELADPTEPEADDMPDVKPIIKYVVCLDFVIHSTINRVFDCQFQNGSRRRRRYQMEHQT